jgi:hypothetical protein
MTDFRKQMLEAIRSNIERAGHHIYAIQGGESPRYFYTIGLKDVIGGELIFAGMAHMHHGDAGNLVDTFAKNLRAGASVDSLEIGKEPWGKFLLREADHSWSERMLLGVYDYYDCVETRAWQVRPTDPELQTIDLPDMQKPYEPSGSGVWKWLDGGWPHEVSSSTPVVTNKDVLYGYAISELMRWEGDDWEMFSGPGPEVSEDEMILLPIGTLLAFDSTLEAALKIPVGTGLFREFDDQNGEAGPWQGWNSKSNS